MFDPLISQHNGRELVAVDDLALDEVGVQVRSGDNFFGIYAFPDQARAQRFAALVGHTAFYETGQLVFGGLFIKRPAGVEQERERD